MKIHLETDRLILRDILPSDEEGLFELDSNPAVHRYLGNRPFENIEQTRTLIHNIRQQYVDHGIGRWAVIEKTTNGFVGWAGLKFVTEKINRHTGFYDLGYRLIERYWGMGMATESAKATIQYAFEKLNLTELYGMCAIGNTGSKNVLEKTGLRWIERFDLNGTEHNWFKITREQWF